MKRRFLDVAGILALAGVYFVSGKIGLKLAFVNTSVTAVWPPSGLSLAALLLLGYRLWPGVWLGAFLVNFATNGGWAPSLGIACGNTLEALAGAWLANRLAQGRNAFDQAQSIFRFILYPSLLSTTISASCGVTTLCLSNLADWRNFELIWQTWWIGDVVSDLIVAPLLLIWTTGSFPIERGRRLEAALLLLMVLFISEFVFGAWLPPESKAYPLEYLAVPPLVWVALRFFQHGASAGAFLISASALWGTLRGFGPFAGHPQNESLLLLQTFMGTITVTALLLAAVASERKRAEHRLQVQDAVSRILADSATVDWAVRRILQTFCEMDRWDVSAFWRLTDGNAQLRCVEFWHSPGVPVPAFRQITQELAFKSGIGLPGRVWVSGRPAWIRDVTTDPNFPRGPAASHDGLCTAMSFPVRLAGDVLGVIECFCRRSREPDADFLKMTEALGSQVGQFIERKEAEAALARTEERLREQLERHAESLEQTVAERTGRLRETVGELEAFSYSISHDLRAPLRAMQNYASILQSDEAPRLSVEGKTYIDRIISAANRLDRLIQDVLKYSRVGRLDTPLATVDLEKLLREIIEQYPSFQKPRAEIELQTPLLSVVANEAALTQCISNILGNAVKFVAAGVIPRIRIWSQTEDSQVRLNIADNGIGIAENHRDRIFRIFERVHGESIYEGTGIGLAIAKKAIERMGGEIGVVSELGRGSIFWIRLPAPK